MAEEPPAGRPWPRISIITPSYNQGRYLDQTLRSVLSQGYPNLDYVVVDGGSTDASVSIIREYESRLSWWVSESDNGLYDALNKGFKRTSGDVMGWINSSDVMCPGSLFVLGEIFRSLPSVNWITGIPASLNEEGTTMTTEELCKWSQTRFMAGFLGGVERWIHQEATFWRRSLWDRAGAFLDTTCATAADFELWVRFFRHASLFSANAVLAAYRIHSDALSIRESVRTHALVHRIIEAEVKAVSNPFLLKTVKRIHAAVRPLPKVRGLWRRLLRYNLNHLPGSDSPFFIQCQSGRWVLENW